MDIMQSFRQAQTQSDLFQFWQQEVQLRLQLRVHKDLAISTAQTEGELDFLLRALYFGGGAQDFFIQLQAALNNAAALQWWKFSPEWLKKEFFSYLTDQMTNYDGDISRLQFLIHLYEPGLNQYYSQLLSRLNLSQCRYLLSKTANGSLRSLLKAREAHILAEQEDRYYGLLNSPDFDNNDLTAKPEKSQLFKGAVLQLDKTKSQYFSDPYGDHRLRFLLDVVDKVYQCGLIEDAFLLIVQIYRTYENQQRWHEILLDQRLATRINRLVSKIVGTIVLLHSAPRIADQAAQFYQQYFPALEADQNLRAMLILYEAILSAPSQFTSIPWEILSCYEVILQTFPDRSLPELGSPTAVPDAGPKLLEVIHSLGTSSPHEAFIIMELTRIMVHYSLIPWNKGDGERLLNYYIKMWKWVPSQRFLNARILDDLSHGAEASSRQEAERILSWSGPGKSDSLLADLQKRPDLYRGGNEPIRSQALYGFLLGVLE